jgi:puromycin-sensitive aminopeptidase
MDVKEEKLLSESEGETMKLVSFHTTPVMSTYLVAIAVCDFDHIEKQTKDHVRVRVYTQKDNIHQAHFALDSAVKILEWYAEYFAIPYPLPKLDMIAIPDFAAGAMENWGLVTYRQVSLLYDPQHSTTKVMQHIAYIVAHELAHQWFGNLVTMEWWTHLWLNEGFATWVGWRAVDHLFPEWHIWTHFITTETNRGLELDSLKSSHPIEVDVSRATEIDEIFDAISYAKGACVIRMLVFYLGEEGFQKGVRAYLETYQYSNALTQVYNEESKKRIMFLLE